MADRMIFDLVRTVLLAGQSAGVLADYLEEQGHPSAEVIRQSRSKLAIISKLIGQGLSVFDVLHLPFPNRQKLALVLTPAVLTEQTLGLLACDFAEHVVPHYRLTRIYVDHQRLRSALETRRQRWLGLVDDTCYNTAQRVNLAAIRDRIDKLRQEIQQGLHGPDHNLAIMVMRTIEVALGETQAAYETAQLATEAVAGVFGQSTRRSARNSLPSKEEHWQVRRIREVIEGNPSRLTTR